MPRPNPQRARWKIRLFLLLGLPVLLLALLELGATWWLGTTFERGRTVGNNWTAVGKRDPHLGWANRPGASGHIAQGNIDYHPKINSLGFRDPERSLQKPKGTRRIVVLGDSVSWGWGVELGQRYSDLLEARLGPGVEVINLAVPGYGTDQSFWNLERSGWAYEPDAVLYCAVLNDLFEAEENFQYGMDKPRFQQAPDGSWSVERPAGLDQIGGLRDLGKRLFRSLLIHSALVATCAGVELDRGETWDQDSVVFHDPGDWERNLVKESAAWIGTQGKRSHHALEVLAQACHARGVPLVVTSVAHKHDRYVYEPRFPCPPDARLAGSDFQTPLTQALAQTSQTLRFDVVSVDGCMLESALAGERLHVGDGHPNARGHALIAAALEPALRSLLKR